MAATPVMGNLVSNSITLNRPIGLSLSSASWTPSTLTLTQTNAFAGYTWQSGDTLWLYNGNYGTLANYGSYTIARKVSADAIQLTESFSSSTLTGVVYSYDGVTPVFRLSSGMALLKYFRAFNTYAGTTTFNLSIGVISVYPDASAVENVSIGTKQLASLTYNTLLWTPGNLIENDVSNVQTTTRQAIDSDFVGIPQFVKTPELAVLFGDSYIVAKVDAAPAALPMTWQLWWKSMTPGAQIATVT